MKGTMYGNIASSTILNMTMTMLQWIIYAAQAINNFGQVHNGKALLKQKIETHMNLVLRFIH